MKLSEQRWIGKRERCAARRQVRPHQRLAPFAPPTRAWAAPRSQGGATFARSLNHSSGRGEAAGPGVGCPGPQSPRSPLARWPCRSCPSHGVGFGPRGPHLGARFRSDRTRSQFRLGTAAGREGGAVGTPERRGLSSRGSVETVPCAGDKECPESAGSITATPARQPRRLGDPGSGVRC